MRNLKSAPTCFDIELSLFRLHVLVLDINPAVTCYWFPSNPGIENIQLEWQFCFDLIACITLHFNDFPPMVFLTLLFEYNLNHFILFKFGTAQQEG